MEKFLSVRELADAWGISEFSVLRRIRQNSDGPQLKFIRLGGRIRFRQTDVDEYIAALENAPAPNARKT